MKLDDQHLLELRCELEELITEREVMLTANRQGEFPQYSKESFIQIRNQIKDLRERIIRLGER